MISIYYLNTNYPPPLQLYFSFRRSTANSPEFKVPRTCTLCFKKFCLECDYLKHVNVHNQEIFEANAKLSGSILFCFFVF